MGPLVSPVPKGAKYLRSDQGIDFLSPQAILAPAAGIITAITHGWSGGTGTGVYLTFDEPITVNGRVYTQFYSAESTPLVQKGAHVAAGTPLASSGSVEIGFWPSPLVGGKGAGTKVTEQAKDFGSFVASLGADVPASAQADRTSAPLWQGIVNSVEHPLRAGTGIFAGAAKSVGSIGGAAANVVEAPVKVADFLGHLTNPGFLLRVLQIVAGALLVAAGLYLLARQVGLAVPSPLEVAGAVV